MFTQRQFKLLLRTLVNCAIIVACGPTSFGDKARKEALKEIDEH